MRHHQGRNLALLQHGTHLLSGSNELDTYAFLWLERDSFLFGYDPVDLPPRNAIFRLQIPLGQNGERRLKSAETHFLSDEILQRVDSRVDVHPYLREAKKSSRKNRNGGKRHAAALRHQVGRERQLADIELAFLQHPLVPVRVVLQRLRLAHFEQCKVVPFDANRAVDKRNVAVIVRERHREFWISHGASSKVRDCLCQLVFAYFILPFFSTLVLWFREHV